MSSGTQKIVKEFLFFAIRQEKHKITAETLANIIAYLGVTIRTLDAEKKAQLTEEGTEWKELMNNVWDLLTSENKMLVESGLGIVGPLFLNCKQDEHILREEFIKGFEESVENENVKIKGLSINVLWTFLAGLGPNPHKEFQDLLPLVFDNILIIVDEDQDWVISPPFDFILMFNRQMMY